jgi:colanic acid/amylovoran biosynthesis glycosyltransferase
LQELGANRNQTDVHHLGIDPARFDPSYINIGNELKLLTVARLVPKKGIRYALEAVNKLKKLESDKKITYNIIGQGENRPQLEQLVVELGLNDTVNFLGAKPRKEVIFHLKKSHLFLHPSVTALNGDQEGTPTVIIEAMASKTPVISTYHSGIPEIIDDGETGWLVPERDPATLANKLEVALSDAVDLKKIADESRKKIETEFNVNKLTEELFELYSNLIT